MARALSYPIATGLVIGVWTNYLIALYALADPAQWPQWMVLGLVLVLCALLLAGWGSARRTPGSVPAALAQALQEASTECADLRAFAQHVLATTERCRAAERALGDGALRALRYYEDSGAPYVIVDRGLQEALWVGAPLRLWLDTGKVLLGEPVERPCGTAHVTHPQPTMSHAMVSGAALQEGPWARLHDTFIAGGRDLVTLSKAGVKVRAELLWPHDVHTVPSASGPEPPEPEEVSTDG